MRVTVIGRTYLIRANRYKWHYLPPGISLTLITTQKKQHVLKTYHVEQSDRWPHEILPGYWTNRLSGFNLSPFKLWQVLRKSKPALIQIDEEPSNLALLEVLLFKLLLNYRVIFFTWENLVIDFSIPFRLVRYLNLKLADGAITGNQEAAQLLRSWNFNQPIATIPQLGIEPEHFKPNRNRQLRQELGLTAFTIGFIGRLVEEKGIFVLLEALNSLEGVWQWLIIGRGAQQDLLRQRIQALNLSHRVRWLDTVAHDKVADYLNAIDVLVLPSITTAYWKEQFGHILIEAMACGLPVVGSNSGAIPEVIQDARLIFPEKDYQTLTKLLRQLMTDKVYYRQMADACYARALTCFTNQHIAQQTVLFWIQVLQHHQQQTIAADEFWWQTKPSHVKLQYLQWAVGHTALDIGTGRGFYAQALGTKGFRVTCVDLFPSIGNPNSIIQATITHLPFKTAFDTVLAFDVLEHEANEAEALQELHRLTGKRLLISVPNADRSKLVPYNLTYKHHTDKTHCREYQADELVQKLERAGFNVLFINREGPVHPAIFSEFFRGKLLRWGVKYAIKILFKLKLLHSSELMADLYVVAEPAK